MTSPDTSYAPVGAPSPDQLALELLHQGNQTHERMCVLVERVRQGLEEPAAIQPVRLTAAVPRAAQIGAGRSIGVLNPTSIVVYIAVGGGVAAPNSEAVPVPPTSLLVLPVEVNGVELGADPADVATSDAVVFALTFPCVQPAHLGVLR